MKKFITALIILIITSGFAFAKDYTVVKKAGNYTVEVKLDKNPPITGQNKMEINIKDEKRRQYNRRYSDSGLQHAGYAGNAGHELQSKSRIEW